MTQRSALRSGFFGGLLALAFVAALAVFAFSLFAQQAEGSRNASGSYALPNGNPVATHTTITSTWANNTLSDIGTELTNSLDRNGRGAMLAPLQLASGNSTNPSLTFASELTSGLYRNSAGDIRMQVGSINAQKWFGTNPGSTFPIGISVTQTAANGNAVSGTGNGSGTGLVGNGGTTSGTGIVGTGGAPNGTGITGFGTGAGFGIQGIGGTNSLGGSFSGGGGGSGGDGVTAVGSGTTGRGIVANGSGTQPGGVFNNGTAASGGTRRDAVSLVNGDLSLDGVTDASSTTAVKNRLTPSNLVKAWGNCNTNAAACSPAAFNVASASCASSCLVVTLAQAFSGAYAVVATINGGSPGNGETLNVVETNSSTITICDSTSAGAVTMCASNRNIGFVAIGFQ